MPTQEYETAQEAPLVLTSDDENSADANASVAVRGVARVFEEMDFVSELSLEAGSVYGAAVALPQVARSTGWHPTFTMLAIRSYILLIMSIVLQLYLVTFIGESTEIMAPLGGQMHLCDFGHNLDECPGAAHCTGPGGTRYFNTRLQSFVMFSIKQFAKQGMLDVFPDKTDLINEKVDPGEYGVENQTCRLVCIFLFTMSVVKDLFHCFTLASLLYRLPTKDDSWIAYHDQGPTEGDWHKQVLGLLKFKVVGMPLHWKAICFCTILLPKALLWLFVFWEGTCLLLETSAIVDQVLGAVAMTFVLSIDEMALDTLGTIASKHIMTNLEPFPVHGSDRDSMPKGADELLSRVANKSSHSSLKVAFSVLVPKRLMLVIVLMFLAVAKYYHKNCYSTEGHWWPGDGTWVSVDMYTPKSSYFSVSDFMNVFWTDAVSKSKKPFWSMHHER
mmetsp:Transcript_130890/g.407005  ORF Transcript_130890/g.407005 Transcript_130890/m.407005 type:complete len:445 (-) Transcript_130890:317-1651(-)